MNQAEENMEIIFGPNSMHIITLPNGKKRMLSTVKICDRCYTSISLDDLDLELFAPCPEDIKCPECGHINNPSQHTQNKRVDEFVENGVDDLVYGEDK